MEELTEKKFDCIIFDFDGTLADSGEISMKAINSMAEKYGFRNIGWDDVNEMRTMSINDRCRYMGVSILKIPVFASDFYLYYKTHMDDLKLYPGIGDLAEKLHDEDYQLAVLSSNSENNIRHFFEKNNITQFNNIMCSNHIFSKDTMINRFARRHGIQKDRILYVGDELRDIEACKRAGVTVVWVDWGLDLPETVLGAKPDYMVSKPEEIYNIINSGGMNNEN
ncbi:MAG: HAD-IIIA family hydrolase [Clostridia bacterium]|nr:HAD-IIIA family hydrolase [Clostridia bacterium]MBN2882885.1 HAD-IIIA family hydrolase [Clostridia bacterium]